MAIDEADVSNDELKNLVQSLNDLDAEYEAGDVDETEYRRLRSAYTVRLADAARRLESPVGSSPDEADADSAGGGQAGDSGRSARVLLSKRRLRQVVVVLGVLALSVGVGWLLARSAGERGVGQALTGDIDGTARDQVARCHDLALVDEQLLDSLQCFDGVLAENPHNVEALTYRAWYLVVATSADDVVTPEQKETLLASASEYLDQAVLVDPDYPDAWTFRAVVADREGRSEDVCSNVAALLALDPGPFFVDQVQPLAERNGCE
ncbi:MAG: hypothetical protein OES24_09535 [Acidimicrobiia bacterium]|nr:hypothetical protein [Acidimicrobiia bacterium]